MASLRQAPSIQVARGPSPEDDADINSKVKKMKPHVPGIVTFADHNRQLPWTVTYHAVVMFADISGFTALCEKYSGMGQSGVDQLTRTLNEYLGALVEGILGSDGDILKFAGDAILAIWRVGRVEELTAELAKVVGCCLDIQDKCGEWDTDIGVKLTVKIGVSAGEMSVTFLGNNEYRHYVELGPAVTAVNAAEAFCQSGEVVMSPEAWDLYARQDRYAVDFLEDHRHVKVGGMRPGERVRSYSLPTPSLIEPPQLTASGRKLSLPENEDQLERRKSPFKLDARNKLDTISSAVTIEVTSSAPEATEGESKPKQMKGMIAGKMKIGSKFGKLRKVVETVTEMRLDLALRLYILLPVLKKLDDDQPLEYLSEMRQVSIVFMNLVLDERTDSTNLLQKIFELVYTQTKSMHGCLNKVFLFDKGCTFLIIFGLPGYKHEQDCAHAILSSGRMKTRLNTISGVKRVSIGVTTGTTFCGVVGHPSRHEYSVIGRKVNMAARLMMHYPNKVTCDNETFQNCRLPPSNFADLVTKQMKGLTNVGVIREFLEQLKEDTMVPKSINHSDYPLLGRQVEEFTFREQLTKMKTSDNRKHLVFSGAAGIGKTKLLDHMVDISEDQNMKVISCCIELHGSSIPYFIAGHILRTLLSNCGIESEAEQEEHLMEQLSESSSHYLYLLNDVIGFNCEKPAHLSKTNIDEKTKKRELLRTVSQACLLPGSETVIVIDDAQNIDTASWEFMCELCHIKQILVVLGLRPSIIEKPSCKEAIQFIEDPEVKMIDLGGLDLKFMAPLACQMMDVVSLPKDLDKILRERSHGVPAWCMEMLKDILDKQQLIVVLDDGRPEFRQSALIPNRLLVKPVRSSNMLRQPSHTILKVSVTDMEDAEKRDENAILESLGYSHEAPLQMNRRKASLAIATKATRRGLHVPAFHDNAVNIEALETTEPERIAIFAKGITAFDIPVPRSMKELIIARLDSMRASDQLLVKCAAVLGMTIRKDILEMLLPKAHRPKMSRYIRRLMESGIFLCGKTPTSHGAQLVGIKDDASSGKYRCYCPRESVISKIGELQVCSFPKFTNSLLQQTAYECLLEAQRVELHAKAARYLEISADEFRENIPYHILARPPPDYLQEALENPDVFDPFARHKRHRRNQVEDEFINEHAEWSRAKRGRRQAVFIAAEDATPLINRIVDQAKPLQHVHRHVEDLIPIYDSLLYHWKSAGKPWNVLTTLLEATAAAIAVKKNAKAFELVGEARTLMKEQIATTENEDETTVFQAKVYRLHGKILFQAGHIPEAYENLTKAGELLGLKQPSKGARMTVFTAKLLARFYLYWKFHVVGNPPASFRVLEQGYCLTDLYRMGIERGDAQLKLVHALQQFTKIAGRKIHLHQIITAYSSMIECCRERSWFDISDKLEEELLRGCAARHGELSTEDRSTLGGIFARSCFTFFVRGDLKNAEKAGRDAAEICVCIQDLHLTKFITPYYVHLCLMRNTYESSVDLLHQYKFASQMTDDSIARAIYYTLCLEVALAGGCPPETPESCFAFIAEYLRTCDAVKTEIMIRFYVAMTVALWCARRERWEDIQTWFDYWEMYQTEDDFSFFSLLGRANKIESMLLSVSKCLEIGNTGVAKMLKTNIQQDLHWFSENIDMNPVLQPRLMHLKAYFAILNQLSGKGRRKIGKATNCANEQGNLHEAQWMLRNKERWRKGKFDTKCNEVWQEHTSSHHLEWQLKSGLSVGMNMYTLPLPHH